MKRTLISVVLILCIFGGVLLGLMQIRPQGKGSVTQDSGYDQMISNLEEITNIGPKVAGSPGGVQALEFLKGKVADMGLESTIMPFNLDVNSVIASWQKDYDSSPLWKNKIDGYLKTQGFKDIEEMVRFQTQSEGKDVLTLNNLLVKLEAPNSTSAVLFVAHYDSVAMGPGTADDGLAVSCMLEAMKDLASKQDQLVNNVYFLFTDGEEQGLLGAHDFVTNYPQYKEEIDVVFNFEARGNAGALLMFETSPNSLLLVRQYSKEIYQPVSTSIATAVYKKMPNGTDFTEFLKAGYSGLNFAMIEGSEHYHKPTDNMEYLNKDTAYQYYRTIQSLSNYYGFTPITENTHNQEGVFFPLFQGNLVVMSDTAAAILGFVPLVLAAILMGLAVKVEQLKGKKLVARFILLLVLGIIPLLVSLLFSPGSYLFVLPVIGLLLVQGALTVLKKIHPIWATLLLAVTTVLTALLFVPIVFLIQLALGTFYITMILALVPLIPLVLYGFRVVKHWGKPAIDKK